ncbi:MAG: cytochrome d ubiquinol oxidase subunit I [Verrucomicrobiales bacterium]|jgi:cytochrome d ubiquinol oxidase subunit I
MFEVTVSVLEGAVLTPDLMFVADVHVAADALLPARNQMALSLGTHIILACFGMAMPAMIYVLHRKGINGDEAALELAKRWSKIAGVLFAIGAVSGTILSFEMGLLWPGLMERYGDVLGTAFALEGLSFFVEAIFLGIYVYGWGRLPQRTHVLMLLPMVIAGVTGSFFVVSVNAWMNAPTGFTEVDGVVVDVDPLAAIFNSAVPLQFLHMFLAAYMVTGFGLASIYAFGWLRGRRGKLQKLGILVPLTFAAIATPIQPIVGHFAGQRIADEQPIKLAAIEGLSDTEESVKTVIGGVYTNGELVGEITLPIGGLASFLAQNDRDAPIIGLNSVPLDEQPPVNIVRFSFQVMVAIGTALVGLVAVVAWRWWRRRDTFFESSWMLRAIAVSGVAAVGAMEAGWITTEVGRQPWIVQGLMRTEEAVTDGGWVWFSLVGLTIIYLGLGLAGVGVLRSMSRRWSAGETDLESPYGPGRFDEPVRFDKIAP